jgi:hypothetical protein
MFFVIQRINSYYIRTVIYTIISGWFIARFCDGYDISCQIDSLTVHFLIWQIIFIITKWESDALPLFSVNIYRGWLIIMVAAISFLNYDIMLRYLPIQMNFVNMWIYSLVDM